MSLGVEESSQFLRMCLGGHRADDGRLLDIDDDDDFWSTQDDDGEEFGECAEFFAMADSDGEEDEDADLEDAYNFDPDICAQLLKRNSFTMEELTEKLQESMVQALERRLNAQTDAIECCAAAGPHESMEERPDCQGDVAGRMTPPLDHPGSMTPPVDVSTHTGPDEQTVAEKLEKAQHRARRSSVIKRDAIQDAMSKAVSRHRRSLLSKVSEKNEDGSRAASPEGKIGVAMQNAQKRHRLSILKAAETLDVARLDDEDDAAVSKKLQMVHKAMEEARTRHRRSIASAVQNITGAVAEQPSEPVSGMSAEARPFHPEQCIQLRIQNAIASAHRRQQQPQQQHVFHPSSTQNFHGQSSELGSWQANMDYSNHLSQVYGDQQPWLSGPLGCEQAWPATLVSA